MVLSFTDFHLFSSTEMCLEKCWSSLVGLRMFQCRLVRFSFFVNPCSKQQLYFLNPMSLLLLHMIHPGSSSNFTSSQWLIVNSKWCSVSDWLQLTAKFWFKLFPKNRDQYSFLPFYAIYKSCSFLFPPLFSFLNYFI